MIVTKYYCDICGKELETASDIDVFNYGIYGEKSWEVCADCKAEILRFMKAFGERRDDE